MILDTGSRLCFNGTMTDTATTDRYGFPVRTCRRCGGSGQYSFNPRDGSRCFGCAGSGLQHTPKAAKAFAAWQTAAKALVRPTANQLAVGDEVREYYAPKGSPFSAIVSIEDTGEVVAWSGPERTPTATRLVVTLANGEVWKMSGLQMVRRYGVLDKEPFLAAAR